MIDATYCTSSCHAFKGYGYKHGGILFRAVHDDISVSEIQDLHVLSMLGGTIGITIGEAVISSTLQQKLSGIADLTFNNSAASINDNVRKIAMIPVCGLH